MWMLSVALSLLDQGLKIRTDSKPIYSLNTQHSTAGLLCIQACMSIVHVYSMKMLTKRKIYIPVPLPEACVVGPVSFQFYEPQNYTTNHRQVLKQCTKSG